MSDRSVPDRFKAFVESRMPEGALANEEAITSYDATRTNWPLISRVDMSVMTEVGQTPEHAIVLVGCLGAHATGLILKGSEWENCEGGNSYPISTYAHNTQSGTVEEARQNVEAVATELMRQILEAETLGKLVRIAE